MISFKNFRTDQFFFFKYFVAQMIFTLSLAYLVKDIQHSVFIWNNWFILLPFAALIFGLQVPVTLHNAVHYNIKPRLLNEIVGEICGFFVLFGMAPFRISHVIHHAHADDPELDTHPPMGKSFFYFLTTTQLNTIKVIARQYFSLHGKNRSTRTIMTAQMAAYYVGLLARVFIWYKITGSALFALFFLPAYITNLVVFAHINWATHRTLPNGEVVIVNLNHNLYYKTINFLGAGAYFHLNHHERPKLYNPSRMPSAPVKAAQISASHEQVG